MFGSDRRYVWPVVNQCIDILPEPRTLVLGPRVVGFGSRGGWGCLLDCVRFKELNATSIC